MMKTTQQNTLGLDKPAMYRIKIESRLNENWADSFNGMTITVEQQANRPTVTTLTGIVTDQSTLHGLLKHIRDLGLPLLLVERIERE
jgi:hypothetical protein